MSAEPAVSNHTWNVTYSSFASNAGGRPTATAVKVEAAYFAVDEHLVLFKDLDHQVVFALHTGTVSVIWRDGAPVQWQGS